MKNNPLCQIKYGLSLRPSLPVSAFSPPPPPQLNCINQLISPKVIVIHRFCNQWDLGSIPATVGLKILSLPVLCIRYYHSEPLTGIQIQIIIPCCFGPLKTRPWLSVCLQGVAGMIFSAGGRYPPKGGATNIALYPETVVRKGGRRGLRIRRKGSFSCLLSQKLLTRCSNRATSWSRLRDKSVGIQLQ